MTSDPSAADIRRRTAYLVLGAHRSGTSATARMLALAGADLPRHVMPGDAHNARGYFEPWKIARFNDERLRAAGGAWDDPFGFPHRALPRDSERAWLDQAAQLFTQEFGKAARPLLKDPRVTILAPFWREALQGLNLEIRCVIPVRRPLAVAGSLARRNGFSPEKSLLIWSAYMLAAEAYTRDLPRVFVGYDRLLDNWRGELTRIDSGLGGELPLLTDAAAKKIEAFLSPTLRHNTGADGLDRYGWVGALTATVEAWFDAAAADQPWAVEHLDAAAAEIARRREEIGALISPAARDLDAARAELVELRQSEAFQRQRVSDLDAEVQRLLAHQSLLRDQRTETLALVDQLMARG